MKVTITSIELRSPFKFFALSYSAMNILKQLKGTNCVAMKKKGFWTTHYTMTLWPTEVDLKEFSRSGAHLEAMKKSAEIATEIRTLSIDADELPSWPEAISRLRQEGQTHSFRAPAA